MRGSYYAREGVSAAPATTNAAPDYYGAVCRKNYPSTLGLVGDLDYGDRHHHLVEKTRERVVDEHGNTLGHKVTTYVIGDGRSFPKDAKNKVHQIGVPERRPPQTRPLQKQTIQKHGSKTNVTLRVRHLSVAHGGEFRNDETSNFSGVIFIEPQTKLWQVRRLLKSEGVVHSDAFDFIVDGAPISSVQEKKLCADIFKERENGHPLERGPAYTCSIRDRRDGKSSRKAKQRQADHTEDMKRVLRRLAKQFGRGRIFNIFRSRDERETGSLTLYEFSAALKQAFRRDLTEKDSASLFVRLDSCGDAKLSFSDLEAYTSALDMQADIEVTKTCERLKRALQSAASEGFTIDVKMSDLKSLPGSGSAISSSHRCDQRSASRRVGDRVWYARLRTEGIIVSIDNVGVPSNLPSDRRVCRLKIIGGASAVRNVFEDFDEDWTGRVSKAQLQKILGALGIDKQKMRFDDGAASRIMDRFGNLVGRIELMYKKLIAFAFPRLIDSETHAVKNIVLKFKDAIRHKDFGEAALRSVFRRFDKAKTGYITPLELWRGIESMGIDFTQYDARRLLERLDPGEHYEKINYVEFASMVKHEGRGAVMERGRVGAVADRHRNASTDLVAALRRKLRDMVIESCTLEASCNCCGDDDDKRRRCDHDATWKHRWFAPSSNPNSSTVPFSGAAIRRVGHAKEGVTCDVPWKEGSLELLAFRDFQEFGRRQEIFERSSSNPGKPRRRRLLERGKSDSRSKRDYSYDSMTLGEFQLAIIYVLGNDFEIHPSDVKRLVHTIDASGRGHVHKDDFISFLKRGKPAKKDVELIGEELRRRLVSEWRSGRESFGSMYERFSPVRRKRRGTIGSSNSSGSRKWCYSFGPKGLMGGAASFGVPLGYEEASMLFDIMEGAASDDSMGVTFRDFLRFVSESQAALIDALVNTFRRSVRKASQRGVAVKRTFERFDPRSRGTIDMASFQTCLGELRIRLTDDEVVQILDHFALDYLSELSFAGKSNGADTNKVYATEKDKRGKSERGLVAHDRIRYAEFLNYVLSEGMYASSAETQTSSSSYCGGGHQVESNEQCVRSSNVARSLDAPSFSQMNRHPHSSSASPTRSRITAAEERRGRRGRKSNGGNAMRWSMPL